MATNPANTYCAIADVQDILSAEGVQLSVDDAPPNVYGDAIARACNRVDFFLFRRYEPSELAKSDLVKDWSAVLAAYYLRTRRGNPIPPGLAALLGDALEDMKQVQKGQNEIPGIVMRRSYVPAMSKMRATLRPYPRAVVEKSQGTRAGGDPAGYKQHIDPHDAVGANDNLDYVL